MKTNAFHHWFFVAAWSLIGLNDLKAQTELTADQLTIQQSAKFGTLIDEAGGTGFTMDVLQTQYETETIVCVFPPPASIDWDFEIAISVNNSNVLAPKWLLSGHKQDGFPAYEIYVRDSDGSSGDEKGTPVYQYDPIPLGRTPEDLFPAPVGADETVLPANGTIP